MDFVHIQNCAFASKNLKQTHSKATCCVEDNDTIFIIFSAILTNSAARPEAEQDDHVDSARVLPRLKILLHPSRRQREKVV